jgi:uncharacterized caspase-like protein
MMRFIALFALVACLLFDLQPSRAETRVALVIGNGAYKNAPRLFNPRNDAEDVAAAFKRSGFETIVGLDLDKVAMEDAEIRFARAARTADVAVFYYSGHAIQFAGVNYLAPVDIKLTDEADLRRMVKLDELVSDVQQAKNLRILVLDACRDNPLADELKRSIGATRALPLQRGLAKIDAPQGMIVAYATQAGRTASDGDGRNSPYTTAFLTHIEEQEEIGTVFRRISADVYETTKHDQLPELSLSLIGEFYLKGRLDITVTTPPSTIDPCAAANDHWKSAEAMGTIAAFNDHLSRFPNCAFAGLARARLQDLKNKVAAVVPPVQSSPLPVSPPASNECGSTAETVSLGARAPCPLSLAEERSLKPKDVFKECVNCPEMVVVPAGQFTMGSPKREAGRLGPWEGPQHEVTINRPYAVGKFHVTVEQFAAFVAATGYQVGPQCYTFEDEETKLRDDRSFKNPGFPLHFAQSGSHPAVCLSWDDAKAYVGWMAKATGKGYRLLSEAEWEYAARAGTTTRYIFGNEERDMCRYGNGLGN